MGTWDRVVAASHSIFSSASGEDNPEVSIGFRRPTDAKQY